MIPAQNHIWQKILKANDGDEAERFLASALSFEQKIVCLAYAFSRTPAPRRVLDALENTGILDPTPNVQSWVTRLGEVNAPIDWTALIVWRQEKSPLIALSDLMKGVGEMYKGWVASTNANIQSNYQRSLISIFDTDPMMARLLFNEQPGADLNLFHLSVHPSNTDWLGTSTVPIAKVLLSGLNDRRGETARLLTQNEEGVCPLEIWMDAGSGRRKAWASLQERDAENETNFDVWCNHWFPQHQWSGSPAETWWSNARQNIVGINDPHPLGNPPDDMVEEKRNEAFLLMVDVLKQHMQGVRERKKIRNIYNTYTWNTQHAGAQDAIGLQEFPLDLLTLGLRYRAEWAGDHLRSDEGARSFQARAQKDTRLEDVLSHQTTECLVKWLRDQPLWRTWRTSQGLTLLDLGAKWRRDNWLPKPILVKIAKTCPDLLNHRDDQDRSTMDRLEIPAHTQAELKKIMLAKQITTARKNIKTARNRM